MRNRWFSHGILPVALGLLGLVTVGCGGAESDTAIATDDTVSRTISTTGRYRSLSFVSTAQSLYRRGDTMTVMLSVTNNGASPVEYRNNQCFVHNAVVRREDGSAVAYFGGWGGCTAEERGGTLLPGETYNFNLAWRLGELESWEANYPESHTAKPLPVGRYTVQPYFDVVLISDQATYPQGDKPPKVILAATPIPFTMRERETVTGQVN